MTAPRQIVRQRDFSGGEAVEHAKRRDDEAVVRAAARDLQNCHILPTGAIENRYGRSAVMSLGLGRLEDVTMLAGNNFHLFFSTNLLNVYDSNFALVAAFAGVSWTSSTVKQINFAQYDLSIYITFPGQVPKVLTWAGPGGTWSLASYAEKVIGGQKRTFFYRIAPKSITLTPSATTGTINITFSAAVLVAGMVGTRIRFNGRQMTIATVTGPTTGTATVNETLISNRQNVTTNGPLPNVGDVVSGIPSGASGKVVTGGNPFVVELQTLERFNVGDSFGRGRGQATVVSDAAPTASVVWDQEVMNTYQLWPRSVSVDQNRLIFSDFPSVPSGIGWSALGALDDLYPDVFAADGLATDAMFELVPGKARVYHVMPGADEFVFTDKGLYYIPISETNPLKPGSVSFRTIPGPPASTVRPVSTAQGLLYVTEALNALVAIVGTGQTAQPYLTRAVSELHAHLFSGIVCLAVANDVENLVYVLDADGTVALGRYQPGKEWVGWLPWRATGTVIWLTALGAQVDFLVTLPSGTTVISRLDSSRYLDASVLINAVPAVMSPFRPPGHGDLWIYNGQTVDLMNGLTYLGQRAVALGNLVLQEGDDFSASTIIAGFKWTLHAEPFVGHVQGGQSVGQTVRKRQMATSAVAVQKSTGFALEIFEPHRSDDPSQGTWREFMRAPAYRAGESQDAAPPQREYVQEFTPTGSDHDPRVRIVKDTPGTLRILEIDVQIEA